MKKTNKKWIIVILTVIVTVCVLLLISYLAVTYCIGDLNLFAALVVIVPVICIAAAAFFIGYQIKWDWKKGICMALVLTLISFGIGRLTVFMTGNSLEGIETLKSKDNSSNILSSEQMDELYDELDKKAYEYMLEQGLISEGEEIYGGDGTIDGKIPDNIGENSDASDAEIIRSELYVGIQKSDPVTELIGNVITFFAALGLSFMGNKKQEWKSNK